MKTLFLLLLLPLTTLANDEFAMFDLMMQGNSSMRITELPSATEMIEKADVIVSGRIVDVTPYEHIVADFDNAENFIVIASVALVVELDSVMKGEEVLSRGNRIFVRVVATWAGSERTKKLRSHLYREPVTLILSEYQFSDQGNLRQELHPDSRVGSGDKVYRLIDKRGLEINHRGKIITPLTREE